METSLRCFQKRFSVILRKHGEHNNQLKCTVNNTISDHGFETSKVFFILLLQFSFTPTPSRLSLKAQPRAQRPVLFHLFTHS
jgi:hypothetical protein